MKRNKLKNVSFFTLLVGNYILFTVAIAFIIVSIVATLNYRLNYILREPNIDGLIESISNLSTKEYDKIPLEYLIGKNSYIIVLDKNDNIIYESNTQNGKTSLTKDELKCIQNYYHDSETYIEEYYNDKGEKNIAVTIYYYGEHDKQDKIYVVDKDLNLIYTNTKMDKKSFTKREFAYLTGEYPIGYSVRKSKFNDKYNNKLTLVSYIPVAGAEVWEEIDKANIIAIVGFVVMYILLTGVFIIWMNRKVKKPLKLLNKAIVNVKNGKGETYLNYEGPKEFSDICDNFNDMSKQLSDSEKKRKKLEEDKQKMLADISHDLKTPITVIKGYSKAVCDGLVSKEELDQYLMTIYKKSDSLDELINTFHEYSKLEHPEYKLSLEKLDICEYTRAYLAQKYEEVYINGVELEAEIPEEAIYCYIDKIQLKRVYENIVSNSLKHNNKGISIYFEIKQIEDKVKIIIADNGSGIPKDIVKNIFEPFIVGEKSRTKQGSGLGLALSKKIVQAHGGSINLVPARKDYTTEFEIVLNRKL